jgi:hypothetical protein
MKTIIYLIIIIGWSILQARRKAMREQKRKQALAGESPPAPVSARPLGAVSAEENRAASASARTALVANSEDQFFQDVQQEVPEEIKPLMEQARRTKKKKRDDKQAGNQPVSDEPVERLVKDVSSIGMQNYEKVDAVRKRFVLDRDAIRNYVITREVLGPPRSRKPFRPAMKDRE